MLRLAAGRRAGQPAVRRALLAHVPGAPLGCIRHAGFTPRQGGGGNGASNNNWRPQSQPAQAPPPPQPPVAAAAPLPPAAPNPNKLELSWPTKDDLVYPPFATLDHNIRELITDVERGHRPRPRLLDVVYWWTLYQRGPYPKNATGPYNGIVYAYIKMGAHFLGVQLFKLNPQINWLRATLERVIEAAKKQGDEGAWREALRRRDEGMRELAARPMPVGALAAGAGGGLLAGGAKRGLPLPAGAAGPAAPFGAGAVGVVASDDPVGDPSAMQALLELSVRAGEPARAVAALATLEGYAHGWVGVQAYKDIMMRALQYRDHHSVSIAAYAAVRALLSPLHARQVVFPQQMRHGTIKAVMEPLATLFAGHPQQQPAAAAGAAAGAAGSPDAADASAAPAATATTTTTATAAAGGGNTLLSRYQVFTAVALARLAQYDGGAINTPAAVAPATAQPAAAPAADDDVSGSGDTTAAAAGVGSSPPPPPPPVPYTPPPPDALHRIAASDLATDATLIYLSSLDLGRDANAYLRSAVTGSDAESAVTIIRAFQALACVYHPDTALAALRLAASVGHPALAELSFVEFCRSMQLRRGWTATPAASVLLPPYHTPHGEEAVRLLAVAYAHGGDLQGALRTLALHGMFAASAVPLMKRGEAAEEWVAATALAAGVVGSGSGAVATQNAMAAVANAGLSVTNAAMAADKAAGPSPVPLASEVQAALDLAIAQWSETVSLARRERIMKARAAAQRAAEAGAAAAGIGGGHFADGAAEAGAAGGELADGDAGAAGGAADAEDDVASALEASWADEGAEGDMQALLAGGNAASIAAAAEQAAAAAAAASAAASAKGGLAQVIEAGAADAEAVDDASGSGAFDGMLVQGNDRRFYWFMATGERHLLTPEQVAQAGGAEAAVSEAALASYWNQQQQQGGAAGAAAAAAGGGAPAEPATDVSALLEEDRHSSLATGQLQAPSPAVPGAPPLPITTQRGSTGSPASGDAATGSEGEATAALLGADSAASAAGDVPVVTEDVAASPASEAGGADASATAVPPPTDEEEVATTGGKGTAAAAAAVAAARATAASAAAAAPAAAATTAATAATAAATSATASGSVTMPPHRLPGAVLAKSLVGLGFQDTRFSSSTDPLASALFASSGLDRQLMSDSHQAAAAVASAILDGGHDNSTLAFGQFWLTALAQALLDAAAVGPYWVQALATHCYADAVTDVRAAYAAARAVNTPAPGSSGGGGAAADGEGAPTGTTMPPQLAAVAPPLTTFSARLTAERVAEEGYTIVGPTVRDAIVYLQDCAARASRGAAGASYERLSPVSSALANQAAVLARNIGVLNASASAAASATASSSTSAAAQAAGRKGAAKKGGAAPADKQSQQQQLLQSLLELSGGVGAGSSGEFDSKHPLLAATGQLPPPPKLSNALVNALLASTARSRHAHSTRALFYLLLEHGDMVPDGDSYAALMRMLQQPLMMDIHQGRAILNRMEQDDRVKPNAALHAHLITFLARSGRVSAALNLLPKAMTEWTPGLPTPAPGSYRPPAEMFYALLRAITGAVAARRITYDDGWLHINKIDRLCFSPKTGCGYRRDELLMEETRIKMLMARSYASRNTQAQAAGSSGAASSGTTDAAAASAPFTGKPGDSGATTATTASTSLTAAIGGPPRPRASAAPGSGGAGKPARPSTTTGGATGSDADVLTVDDLVAADESTASVAGASSLRAAAPGSAFAAAVAAARAGKRPGGGAGGTRNDLR